MANDWSNSIACEEEAGSAQEQYDDERGVMSATVVLRCAYADRHSLVADICGNRRDWPKGAAGAVPKAYSAGIMPVVDDPYTVTDHVITYGEALVTIKYSNKFVDILTEEIEATTEFLTVDHRWFRWGSASGDPVREEESPGILVRQMNLVRSLPNISQAQFHADMWDKIGNVNSSSYASTLLNRTFAAETLLYAPPKVSYKLDSSNVAKYDLQQKFTINPNGWNVFFRPKTNTWTAQYVAGGAQFKPYTPASLSNVIITP